MASFLARSRLLSSSMSFGKDWNQRINLTDDLFVGEVFQLYCARGALGVAQAVSFAENRIDRSLLALFGILQLYGTIDAYLGAFAASHAFARVHLADGAGSDHGIMGD